jgi:hypothetical protein
MTSGLSRSNAPHPLQQSRLLLERIDWRLEAAQVVDVAWEVGAAGIGIGIGIGIDIGGVCVDG